MKKWLTNTSSEKVRYIIDDLLSQQKNRVFIIDEPKKTDKYSTKELQKMNMVGLYEEILEIDDEIDQKVEQKPF